MSSDRRKAFEARLAQLKHQMERGLVERASTLRAAADALLEGDTEARRALKSEGHKLRGIAGTYGHDALTRLAARLEQKASIAPPASVAELARELADAAERTGRASVPPVEPAPDPVAAKRPSSFPGTSGRQRMVSERPRIRAADGHALKVLAMDDEPNTLRLLTLTLRDVGGFEAVIVDSAVQALAALDQQTFDVVISDAMMPDMSGMEFCIAARKKGGHAASMPIIILSAAAEEELDWLRKLPGPVTWLRKPFSPRGLVKDVARIVEEHRRG